MQLLLLFFSYLLLWKIKLSLYKLHYITRGPIAADTLRRSVDRVG